ncbi:PorT family protein [Hymenobacter qilianensis]|uniref:PorT family protein n=1 Tax=Hymenobacter qilianensis TaxID=1385715 RepID=A0A7H0GSG2_9BACT|nr:porin family protein [Hymenobacter qilianensis]QNP51228.1 PorT family protein [Hymenobacter qilianensis]
MYLVKRATIWLVGFLAPGMAVAQTSVFQPGYVIRAEAPADTIRGYVDTFFAVEKKGVIMFRTTQDAATAQTFTAAQLTAAGTGTQEVYVTRQIPIGDSLQPRFLRVVVRGEASLFITESGEQRARFFIERQGGQAMPLRRGQQLQVLNSVLAGCLALDFADTPANNRAYRYQLDDFKQAVQKYNACKPAQQREQLFSGPPKPGNQVGMRLGVQNSQLYYPDEPIFYNQKPTSGLSPALGVFVKFNLGHRVAIVPELLYGRSNNSFSVVKRVGATSFYYTNTMETQASYVRLPLTLRYTFSRPGRLLRPYIEVGGAGGLVFGAQSLFILVNSELAGGTLGRTQKYSVGRNLLGYHGGAGVDFYSPIGIWGCQSVWRNYFLSTPTKRKISVLTIVSISTISS